MITPADKAHLHSSDGSSSSTSSSDTRTLGVQASKVMRDVQDLGSIAADTVGQTTGRLKAQGREYIEAGRERACKLKGDVAEYVGSNPIKSILLAIGIGALIGISVRRGR